jgi:hypothetical protein
MSIAEVMDDRCELQVEIEQTCRTVWLEAKVLESYRRHNGARRFLMQDDCLDDMEKARDYLSRVIDDMRGVQ